MIEEQPGRLLASATSRGCPACRRGTTSSSAARPAGGQRRRPGRQERELFRDDAGRRRAAAAHPGRAPAARGRAGPRERRPGRGLVAIRPSTGEILAAANGPGTGGHNIATYGQYAPGSTFKSVSSLALLRAGRPGHRGAVSLPDAWSSTASGSRTTTTTRRRRSADIPLRTAVANSCNTAFISQRGKLGQDALVDAAASLGMGVDHDLGFPAYFGNVVPPAVRDREGRRPDRPGQDPRLPDGDGHGDRLDPGRLTGRARSSSRRVDVAAAGRRRRRSTAARGRRAAGRCCAAWSPAAAARPARRPRPAGDRQDRHRRVRPRRPAPAPTPG